MQCILNPTPMWEYVEVNSVDGFGGQIISSSKTLALIADAIKEQKVDKSRVIFRDYQSEEIEISVVSLKEAIDRSDGFITLYIDDFSVLNFVNNIEE